jgi:hypothetical protein
MAEDVFDLGLKVIPRGLLFTLFFTDALRSGERPADDSFI